MVFSGDNADGLNQWAAARLSEQLADGELLSDDELVQVFEWTCKHGSANCWAGTTGEAAAIIRSLLLEIARLRTSQPNQQPEN